MRIVAIIPSRFGSTRLKGKPLALIAGKPMVQWVYENACRADRISEVVVATDDRRISDVVRGFNGRVLMTSPDHPSGTDRVAEAAAQLELAAEDIAINVQGDQPLVNPACLDAVVAPLMTSSEAAMSTLALEVTDRAEYINPHHCKVVMDHQGHALYFSRAPIPFARDGGEDFTVYKHLGIYAYTRRFLETFQNLPVGRLEMIEKLEQLRVLEYGYRIKVVVTPHDSPEVNLAEDIRHIEAIMRGIQK